MIDLCNLITKQNAVNKLINENDYFEANAQNEELMSQILSLFPIANEKEREYLTNAQIHALELGKLINDKHTNNVTKQKKFIEKRNRHLCDAGKIDVTPPKYHMNHKITAVALIGLIIVVGILILAHMHPDSCSCSLPVWANCLPVWIRNMGNMFLATVSSKQLPNCQALVILNAAAGFGISCLVVAVVLLLISLCKYGMRLAAFGRNSLLKAILQKHGL